MDTQKYLDELLVEANAFMEKTEVFRENFPEFFKEGSGDIVLGMTQERMEVFYQTSQVINDTQVLFSKIACFIYFLNKIGTELDLSGLSNIKGLSNFVSGYKPFETDYTITSEGELEVKNKKDNSEKMKNFSRNIKNIIKSKILDESRE